MGQALRKLKPPVSTTASSENVIPVVKRQSKDIKPAPPDPQVIIEPDANVGQRGLPDPNFISMSQKVVGIITTRPAGEKEHPTATIREEYTRPMPTDRHTTLHSSPDEDTVISPGSLNHSHIRELFLLHQGKAEGQEKPLDVESLAKRFNVDAEILERVFRYTSLVHFEVAVPTTMGAAQQMKEDTLQKVKDTVQHSEVMDGLK